ncbi:MAG: D-alanyl-D-alanine carboxypeptidase [Clostridia bacterium]|nr:D-alanyl-D-alanine carboxypeptidase [Clostridia bacterium]
MFKKICSLILIFVFIVCNSVIFAADQTVLTETVGIDIPEPALYSEDAAASTPAFDTDAKSYILMEAHSRQVLAEYNADEGLPPASVTKIMMMLLVLEALDNGKAKLDDTVTASAYAASMGGSQIFLKEGERMSLEDMFKSLVMASANDAAVALAEHIYGSEEACVIAMNERAKELGLTNTLFENTNGLDDTTVDHKMSARDIAVITSEVEKHSAVFDYSTEWMDTIRNGEFGLTNTNKLIRFYPGATGMKTGSTSKAGFCITATAERDGLSLIAVIMGCSTKDARNSLAKTMFDYGFANYSYYSEEKSALEDAKVMRGKTETVKTESDPFSAVLGRGENKKVTFETVYNEEIKAPLKAGDVVGSINYFVGETKIGEAPIRASEDVEAITFISLLIHLWKDCLFI